VPTAARGPASIQLPGAEVFDDDGTRAAVRREVSRPKRAQRRRDELTTALMVVPPADDHAIDPTCPRRVRRAPVDLGLCLVAVEQVPISERVMPPSLFEMARQISSATRSPNESPKTKAADRAA